MSKKTTKVKSIPSVQEVIKSVEHEALNNAVAEQPTKVIEPTYPTELIVTSKVIKSFGLHNDIIRGILNKREYTINDAKYEVQKYIDSFNK
jgi:hypothetical protein